jgi:hypothetical protein
MDPSAIDRMVRKYAAKIGLARGYSAHSMRATFITTALENGAQLEDVPDYHALIGPAEGAAIRIGISHRKRAVVDIVAAGDVADRRAILAPLAGFLLLMRGELRAASELDAALFRLFAAFRRGPRTATTTSAKIEHSLLCCQQQKALRMTQNDAHM